MRLIPYPEKRPQIQKRNQLPQGNSNQLEGRTKAKPMTPLVQENSPMVNKQDDYKASNEFNPLTAATRIVGNGKLSRFALRDSQGNLLEYQKGEEYKGGIYIPAGSLVSKLSANPYFLSYIHIVTWFRGQYREGYIHQSAFDSESTQINPYPVEIFINDAEHTIHKAREKYQAQIDLINSLEDKLSREQFTTYKETRMKRLRNVKTLIEKSEDYLKESKNGELKITEEMLFQIQTEQVQKMSKENLNKPDRLNNIVTGMYSGYNPQGINQAKHSEISLFVPLTKSWFDKNEKLSKSSLAKQFATGGGTYSGFGVLSNEFGAELLWIKSEVNNDDLLKNTPEGKWFSNLKKEQVENAQQFLFADGQSWNQEENSKYIEAIALENSFGPIRIDPLMTLMIHETIVGPISEEDYSYGMDDSHVDIEDSKKSWELANAGEFENKIAKEPLLLEDLFQVESMVSIISLAYIFERIKSLE